MKKRVVSKLTAVFILIFFGLNTLLPPSYAQVVSQTFINLPEAGSMIAPTSAFAPLVIRGLLIYPDNPLKFDFVLDRGDEKLTDDQFKSESTRLVKYFLASLTVPEKDMWVNLSPYEKNRIVPDNFGQTEMGRDLLAQDYMLKQLTSSLMYPENETGKEFWNRVYTKINERFGMTDIPLNTFNKIWIVPEKASIYEHKKGAFIVKSRLKVMLEEDYVAMEHNSFENQEKPTFEKKDDKNLTSTIQSQMVREIIIPEIEREVNEGKTFTQLRQIYYSMILASWYKRALKESLLGKIYVDQNKTEGVDISDKQENQKIYEKYLDAFKKGAYNYIKEDYDPATQEVVTRKYISGGVALGDLALTADVKKDEIDQTVIAMAEPDKASIATVEFDGGKQVRDAAMFKDNSAVKELDGKLKVQISTIVAKNLSFIRNPEAQFEHQLGESSFEIFNETSVKKVIVNFDAQGNFVNFGIEPGESKNKMFKMNILVQYNENLKDVVGYQLSWPFIDQNEIPFEAVAAIVETVNAMNKENYDTRNKEYTDKDEINVDDVWLQVSQSNHSIQELAEQKKDATALKLSNSLISFQRLIDIDVLDDVTVDKNRSQIRSFMSDPGFAGLNSATGSPIAIGWADEQGNIVELSLDETNPKIKERIEKGELFQFTLQFSKDGKAVELIDIEQSKTKEWPKALGNLLISVQMENDFLAGTFNQMPPALGIKSDIPGFTVTKNGEIKMFAEGSLIFYPGEIANPKIYYTLQVKGDDVVVVQHDVTGAETAELEPMKIGQEFSISREYGNPDILITNDQGISRTPIKIKVDRTNKYGFFRFAFTDTGTTYGLTVKPKLFSAPRPIFLSEEEISEISKIIRETFGKKEAGENAELDRAMVATIEETIEMIKGLDIDRIQDYYDQNPIRLNYYVGQFLGLVREIKSGRIPTDKKDLIPFIETFDFNPRLLYRYALKFNGIIEEGLKIEAVESQVRKDEGFYFTATVAAAIMVLGLMVSKSADTFDYTKAVEAIIGAGILYYVPSRFFNFTPLKSLRNLKRTYIQKSAETFIDSLDEKFTIEADSLSEAKQLLEKKIEQWLLGQVDIGWNRFEKVVSAIAANIEVKGTSANRYSLTFQPVTVPSAIDDLDDDGELNFDDEFDSAMATQQLVQRIELMLPQYLPGSAQGLIQEEVAEFRGELTNFDWKDAGKVFTGSVGYMNSDSSGREERYLQIVIRRTDPKTLELTFEDHNKKSSTVTMPADAAMFGLGQKKIELRMQELIKNGIEELVYTSNVGQIYTIQEIISFMGNRFGFSQAQLVAELERQLTVRSRETFDDLKGIEVRSVKKVPGGWQIIEPKTDGITVTENKWRRTLAALLAAVGSFVTIKGDNELGLGNRKPDVLVKEIAKVQEQMLASNTVYYYPKIYPIKQKLSVNGGYLLSDTPEHKEMNDLLTLFLSSRSSLTNLPIASNQRDDDSEDVDKLLNRLSEMINDRSKFSDEDISDIPFGGMIYNNYYYYKYQQKLIQLALNTVKQRGKGVAGPIIKSVAGALDSETKSGGISYVTLESYLQFFAGIISLNQESPILDENSKREIEKTMEILSFLIFKDKSQSEARSGGDLTEEEQFNAAMKRWQEFAPASHKKALEGVNIDLKKYGGSRIINQRTNPKTGETITISQGLPYNDAQLAIMAIAKEIYKKFVLDKGLEQQWLDIVHDDLIFNKPQNLGNLEDVSAEEFGEMKKEEPAKLFQEDYLGLVMSGGLAEIHYPGNVGGYGAERTMQARAKFFMEHILPGAKIIPYSIQDLQLILERLSFTQGIKYNPNTNTAVVIGKNEFNIEEMFNTNIKALVERNFEVGESKEFTLDELEQELSKYSLITPAKEKIEEIVNKFANGTIDFDHQGYDVEKTDKGVRIKRTKVGGIDLNPVNLKMNVNKSGGGVEFNPVSDDALQDLNVNGFVPVIINVTPATNLPMLLGIAPGSEQEGLAKSG